MQPRKLAENLILIYQGTHEFDPVNSGGILAKYFKVTSSVTLYLGTEPTVIDSGARFYRDEIGSRISKYINLLDVECFIATHYHHDHLDNSDLFPNARRILDHGCVTPDGDMTVYDDASAIPAPEGVVIFGTPGHVKNHISAMIEIDGVKYVCAGDSVRMDILTGKFTPSYMDDDYLRSARKVFEMADIIIPGHGELIEIDRANLPPLIKKTE